MVYYYCSKAFLNFEEVFNDTTTFALASTIPYAGMTSFRKHKFS